MSIDGRDTRPPRPPRPRRYFADTSARRFLTLANLVLPLLLLSGLYYAILTLDTDRTLRSPRPNERAHDVPNVLHYPNDSSSSTLRPYNDSIRLLTNASTSHVSLSSLKNPCLFWAFLATKSQYVALCYRHAHLDLEPCCVEHAADLAIASELHKVEAARAPYAQEREEQLPKHSR